MKKRRKPKQSDSSRVTPYQLATLASRIDPERCASDPSGALKDAYDLVRTAKHVLWCAEQEERKDEQELEELEKSVDEIRKDWVHGIKQITDERRRDRATRRFTEFMKHKAPGNDLSHYQSDGFTEREIHYLGIDFTNWKKQPKRKKGKQGHRISESDGRLRTELVGLVPTKPPKRA